jgi:Coenzyme PQQ synthesis protein D (PqqD)
MIQRRAGWLASKVGQELIMMSVEGGVYIGLNEVGARVWEMIGTPKDISELCAGLAAEFDVTEGVCRAEVESFLADLERRGAISRVD